MRVRAGVVPACAAAFAAVLAGCIPQTPPAVPPPPPPTSFTADAPPTGASSPGTSEWYWAPAPDGHAVTLGVYRPATPPTNPITLLLLNGGDGFRRVYEDLAQRFAAQGFIAVVGCWYDHDHTTLAPDAIECVDGPTWKGMNASSVNDVNALVAAALQVPQVDPARLALVGHSYGGGVSMLRAAFGHSEPVVSSAGLLSANGYVGTPLSTDEFPDVVAGGIHGPVLLAHGRYDPITPLSMAQSLASHLPPDNLPSTAYYDWPASHGFPWQSDALRDLPGVPVSVRYVQDATNWLLAVFATTPVTNPAKDYAPISATATPQPPGPPPRSADPTFDQP